MDFGCSSLNLPWSRNPKHSLLWFWSKILSNDQKVWEIQLVLYACHAKWTQWWFCLNKGYLIYMFPRILSGLSSVCSDNWMKMRIVLIAGSKNMSVKQNKRNIPSHYFHSAVIFKSWAGTQKSAKGERDDAMKVQKYEMYEEWLCRSNKKCLLLGPCNRQTPQNNHQISPLRVPASARSNARGGGG